MNLPRTGLTRTLALGGATLFTLAAVHASNTITAIVTEGDTVTGVGDVTRIDAVAVNDSGSWIVEVDTNGADTATDGALVNASGLLLQEGQALTAPTGGSVGSFDSVNLDSVGDSAWNLFIDGTTSSTNSGVFFNTTLVILESDISTAPQFSAGTPYIGWFEVKANDNDQFVMMASVDDVAIASSVDRAIVLVDHDGAGGSITETVLHKEGDAFGGQLAADFGTGPHTFDFNDAGSVLFIVNGDGATATDGILMLDNTLLAQEGSPSPITGRNWASSGISTSQRVALNNNGDYVHTGVLDGDTATDRVIIKNGAKVVQEGDNLPSIGIWNITSIGTSGPVDIDDAGNVLWYGEWDDPDTTRNKGLFLNDELLLQIGVTEVGGQTIEFISGVTDSYAISDNGEWVISEGRLAGGIDAVFLVDLDVGPTVAYCTAGTTTNGCNALLSGSGVPSATSGSGFDISVANAEGAKNGLLFYGISGRSASVWGMGGMASSSFLCVKAPTQRTPPATTTGTAGLCDGTYTIDFNAYLAANPGSLGQPFTAGDVVDAQFWYRDPPSPNTTHLSNGLEFTMCP